MSLKTIDRHFVGSRQSGNYNFYLQLVNSGGEDWIQGSIYKRTMEVYGTLVQPPLTKTPVQDFYDTNEYILLTDYQKHLGSITWDEAKQQWAGTLTIGELTIKKRGASDFGWPTHKTTLTGLWDASTFNTSLYGLLDCGERPMRVFTAANVINNNSFLMQTEPHSMTHIADRFMVVNATNFNDGIGSYTIHYVIHLADADAPTYGGSPAFAGYAGLQYDETTTYNRRTLQGITTSKQWTVLYNESDESPATFGVHWTKFHNRRRYHVTPEEEWFHTSSNPHYAYSLTAMNGMTEFELGGDIESVGCPVVDLPWGLQGVDGGNTFESQLDYDWVFPTTGPGANYPRPDGVTKYINVRRWKWKNLEVNVPRVKIKITTPEGSATTTWVGPNNTTLVDNAENGLGGAGQAFPADDVPPDYPGQGGSGRVPDLVVHPFGYMPTPDSGVSDYQYNNFGMSLSNSTQTISRSGNSPNYLDNHTIEIVDTSKASGWLPSITKVQSSETGHEQDRYIRNGWLTLPRFVWGWPETMSLTVNGATGGAAVLNGSYSLPLRNHAASYITTLQSGSGFGVSYGRAFYGVGPGGLLSVCLLVSSGRWYILYIVNGPSDPLVGRTNASFELNGKVNFLGPITLSLKGTTGATATLVPS